jgi:pseudouridine-5'-phosphate glycosidase
MITLSAEVAAALAAGQPVVALESTIISHGMPWPQNAATARLIEAEIRAGGAVPATIAVINGVLRAGLDDQDLERLGRDPGVVKAASRDLAVAMARGGSAGTTVSATMVIAERAGIAVFATGGVGGVHRGAEASFDISADLVELGRTATAVVCAGVKSILDIPKTLEFLETQRVPVLTYGSDEFPAFYSRHSGQKAEHRCDTPDEIAEIIHRHRGLGIGSGLLIANPIPAEHAVEIEAIVAAAIADAAKQGIIGKALTPFLLARINDLSHGESLTANIALVRNNAAVAAKIAVALAERNRTHAI